MVSESDDVDAASSTFSSTFGEMYLERGSSSDVLKLLSLLSGLP